VINWGLMTVSVKDGNTGKKKSVLLDFGDLLAVGKI
jgi:hypothetical protein